MTLFLLTFFLLYGAFHLYFFLKLRAAFAPGAAAQAIVIVLLLLGLTAPIIVRVSERLGLEILVRLMSWAGYLWMAVLLLVLLRRSPGRSLPPPGLCRRLCSSARTSVRFSRPPGRSFWFRLPRR